MCFECRGAATDRILLVRDDRGRDSIGGAAGIMGPREFGDGGERVDEHSNRRAGTTMDEQAHQWMSSHSNRQAGTAIDEQAQQSMSRHSNR